MTSPFGSREHYRVDSESSVGIIGAHSTVFELPSVKVDFNEALLAANLLRDDDG